MGLVIDYSGISSWASKTETASPAFLIFMENEIGLPLASALTAFSPGWRTCRLPSRTWKGSRSPVVSLMHSVTITSIAPVRVDVLIGGRLVQYEVYSGDRSSDVVHCSCTRDRWGGE